MQVRDRIAEALAMSEQLHPFEVYYPRDVALAAAGLGIVLAVLCLFLVWFRYPYANGVLPADWIVLSGAFFFGGLAGFGVWMFLVNPVAMRFEARGITGRHMPDVAWDDIQTASLSGSGRNTGIGIKLKDRRAVVRRWSLWEKRFLLNLSPDHDFAVLTGVFDQSRDDILAEMQRYLRDADG